MRVFSQAIPDLRARLSHIMVHAKPCMRELHALFVRLFQNAGFKKNEAPQFDAFEHSFGELIQAPQY